MVRGSSPRGPTNKSVALFIAENFVPFQILMIPIRNILIEMEMYNTHIGLIIFHIAFQTGFCTFFKKLYKRTSF